MNVISPGEAAFVGELLDGIDADREADWWWRHSDLVLEGGAIATYFDHTGDVAIRQRCETGDAFVFVPLERLPTLISRLRDLVGDD